MQGEDGWEGALWAEAEQEKKTIRVLHQGVRDSLGWVESGYHLTFSVQFGLEVQDQSGCGIVARLPSLTSFHSQAEVGACQLLALFAPDRRPPASGGHAERLPIWKAT